MTAASPAAAIRPRDDLQKMPIGILEVNPSAPVVVVDLADAVSHGIRPVRKLPLADATEHFIEPVLAQQERVMLLLNRLALVRVEVQRDAVGELDDEERPEARWRRQAEDFREKRRGLLLVAAPDDRVVELDAHVRRAPRAP